MTWIDRRKDWDTSGGRLAKPAAGKFGRRQAERDVYTVAQAAVKLGVTKKTVFKYIEAETIPLAGWFKLPGGHIRIYKWIVDELQG